ncbi:hypothetical protein [uncultured Paludibaculum sp.]|uniref:hypothetical protein n=1 Tax=uncultured Paludibaculum sp. TaxID=1765020 RepID=UPI002AAA7258|nr:hypothetical protein [uncultured Paludibaculum sp.]
MTELTKYDLAFCVRRLPRDVREMMKREGPRLFVAGGFVRSVVANETINDVDLFTPNRDDAERLAKELAGPEHKPYGTGNAYTVFTRRVTCQFIHRWTFEHPEDAMESFDFTIAKAALWWSNGSGGSDPLCMPGWRSACAESFYADLAARRLVYTSPIRNEDAGGSLLRVLKFYQRGYRIPLDSMGAVIARLCQGVEWARLERSRYKDGEAGLAKILTGLLREVDPQVDPDAIGHVDSIPEPTDGLPWCEHGRAIGTCPSCEPASPARSQDVATDAQPYDLDGAA